MRYEEEVESVQVMGRVSERRVQSWPGLSALLRMELVPGPVESSESGSGEVSAFSGKRRTVTELGRNAYGSPCPDGWARREHHCVEYVTLHWAGTQLPVSQNALGAVDEEYPQRMEL